jgi:hypothetical protein
MPPVPTGTLAGGGVVKGAGGVAAASAASHAAWVAASPSVSSCGSSPASKTLMRTVSPRTSTIGRGS